MVNTSDWRNFIPLLLPTTQKPKEYTIPSESPQDESANCVSSVMDDRLAFAGAGTHPSEAIANLQMSTRGFQLRWGRHGESKEDRTSSPPWSGVG